MRVVLHVIKNKTFSLIMYYHFNSLNFTITTLEAITINSLELLFKTRQQTQIFIRINVKKSFCFIVESGYTFLIPVCPPFHLSLCSLIFCSFLGSMHPWKKNCILCWDRDFLARNVLYFVPGVEDKLFVQKEWRAW